MKKGLIEPFRESFIATYLSTYLPRGPDLVIAKGQYLVVHQKNQKIFLQNLFDKEVCIG